MSWTNKLYTFIIDAFRPPFRTSHWMALLYVILSIIYNPNSHFNRWVLPDTDDYTRFVQVFQWLDGHSWFDLTLPHLYPQHVISMHWARLVDIPLAGVLLLLKAIAGFFQWQSERQGLAMLTGFLVPCFLLAALLILVRAMARPLIGKRWAGLACFFVPLALQLMFQFAPMRVDHHAYILLAAGTAFLCLQRLTLGLYPLRMAALAGCAFALGMWNGAEIMPAIIAFCACLTVQQIIKGRASMKAGLVFGAALMATSFLILLIAIAPAQRWSTDYDAFSFFYVILAAYACAFFLGLFILSRFISHKGLLLSSSLLGALGALTHLLSLFPDFIAGPYAKTNPLMQDLFLNNIREAVPFIRAWADLLNNFAIAPQQAVGGAIYFLTTRLFGPVIGSLTALVQLMRPRKATRARLIWLCYAVFCVFFTLLAMFWQVRVISYAQLFAIPPLVWLMLRYLKTLPQHYKGRALFGWEILTVLSFTILPTMVVPSIILQSRLNPDMMFFLGTSTDVPCKDSTRVVAQLREMGKDKPPLTILAPMDYTPELMFYTGHNYIAAPYHRNDRGIIDMIMFFRSKGDDAAARAIAARDSLDYVLVCKMSYFQGTLDSKREINNLSVNIGAKGKMTTAPDKADLYKSSLGFRLAYDTPPPWLEQIGIPLEDNFALFEVKKDLLKRPTSYPKIRDARP